MAKTKKKAPTKPAAKTPKSPPPPPPKRTWYAVLKKRDGTRLRVLHAEGSVFEPEGRPVGKISPLFPDETDRAKYVRLYYNLPDAANVDKEVLNKKRRKQLSFVPPDPLVQRERDWQGLEEYRKYAETVTAPLAAAVKKEKEPKKAPAGVDAFGCKLGTMGAAVNAAMTTDWQDPPTIFERAGLDRPRHGHLKWLVDNGFAVRSTKGRYRLKKKM